MRATHKVIAEVSAGDAEGPHGTDDEHSTAHEGQCRQQLELGIGEDGESRLIGEGDLIPTTSGRRKLAV